MVSLINKKWIGEAHLSSGRSLNTLIEIIHISRSTVMEGITTAGSVVGAGFQVRSIHQI
jgi:hypothetical protein